MTLGSTLRFSDTSYRVNEADGTVVLTVNLDRSDDVDPGATVTVQFKTIPGSAKGGTAADTNRDYTTQDSSTGTVSPPNDAPLTFTPGETSKEIVVPINDDNAVENTETFSVILFAPAATPQSRYSVTLGNTTATVTIFDNDSTSATLGFGSANYSINESPQNNPGNLSSITLTVTRSGTPQQLAQQVNVNYSTQAVTAIENVDYQRTSGTLIFGAGDTSKPITVPIFDDAAVEGDETFAVNLSPSFGGINTATVTIVDNDASTVNFSSSSYSVAENGGAATITLQRTGNVGNSATVSITTVAATASADVDYVTVSQEVTFSPGQTAKTFQVPIVNDALVEGNEFFQISLTTRSGSGVVIGNVPTTMVNIIDDEAANTVEFAGTDFTVNENDPTGLATVVVRLNRNGNNSQTVTVHYFTSTGSATPNQDYIPIAESANRILTFGPGETIKTFSIAIINNAIAENTESVGLVLSNPTNAFLGTATTATLSIVDDDSAGTVQFSSGTYGISENSGSITLTVLLNRTGSTSAPVSVGYTTLAGSAGPDRFVPTNGTISFAAGSSVATIIIPIKNDVVVQPPQTFSVALVNPVNASLGSPSSAAVTIQDDDGINSVELDAADYGAVEIEGAAQIRVRATRGGDPSQVLSVQIALGAPGDTAQNPADYQNPSSTVVTFPAGVSVQTVTIPITNNPAAQGVKTFTAGLTNPGSFTSIGRQSSARVTIFDNSGPNTVQFLTSAHHFREGDQAAIAITVVRFGAFDVNGTTAQFTTEVRQGDTAQAGVNFTPTAGEIRFAPLVADLNGTTVVVDNEHTKTIIIPIPNNTLVQGDVTFHLTLTSADVAQLGSVSTTQITITDDDLGNVVQFVSPTYSVAEAGGNAVLTVKLTPNGDASRASSVDYIATQITAFAGFDFSPVSGTLTFAPGETSKTILVPINNDTIPEDPETFRVTLTSHSLGTIIGPQGNAIVTIADDDAGNISPSFQFNSSAITAANSLGSANVTVILSRGPNSNGTYTVHYATMDISAIAGVDYVASAGTLVFGPGEVSKTISVPLIPQAVGRPASQFKITLSNPTNGAILGDISELVVSITNPDVATKLLNVSTRGPVEQGDGVMIAGFIIKGSSTKQVVLRGIGPSLTQLGVPNAIADPYITLVNANGQQLAFNDDFGTNPQSDLTLLANDGLAPTDAREAALVATLGPGTYTTILNGKTNGTALVEVYDITSTAASSLMNISTRGKVEQSDNGAMIAGFIIAPPANQPGSAVRVAIRAKGPSLTQAGITNALGDTTLDLYRGSQIILSNDNWKTNSSADQTELQANGLAPTNDKEAALVTSLDPGGYTAVVRGKNNTTGVALVEVFRLSP